MGKKVLPKIKRPARLQEDAGDLATVVDEARPEASLDSGTEHVSESPGPNETLSESEARPEEDPGQDHSESTASEAAGDQVEAGYLPPPDFSQRILLAVADFEECHVAQLRGVLPEVGANARHWLETLEREGLLLYRRFRGAGHYRLSQKGLAALSKLRQTQ